MALPRCTRFSSCGSSAPNLRRGDRRRGEGSPSTPPVCGDTRHGDVRAPPTASGCAHVWGPRLGPHPHPSPGPRPSAGPSARPTHSSRRRSFLMVGPSRAGSSEILMASSMAASSPLPPSPRSAGPKHSGRRMSRRTTTLAFSSTLSPAGTGGVRDPPRGRGGGTETLGGELGVPGPRGAGVERGGEPRGQ